MTIQEIFEEFVEEQPYDNQYDMRQWLSVHEIKMIVETIAKRYAQAKLIEAAESARISTNTNGNRFEVNKESITNTPLD